MFTITTELDSKWHPQPRLVGLLASGTNFMPLSWHMPVSKSPFCYAVAIRDENETYNIVKELGEFSINFLDFSQVNAIEISGAMHGGEKFRETGLTPKKAEFINSTLIEEAYTIYECRVVEVLNFGDHDIFIADVLCVHNRNVHNVSPTLFSGRGRYYTVTQNSKEVI